MRSPHPRARRHGAMVSLIAIGAALAGAPGAWAADATPSATPDNSAVQLGEIVVTASGGNKTKLKTSMSVNTVSQQQIQQFTPRSEAEVLRLIPGLQVQDTAGPGGNSNIGVRGIPVVTGGSEFVQLQEDGLPTVLFGDMNFGNNDYWTRYDTNVTKVEAVRGGGASTFASQAPGAVVNYISDTGEHDGGSIGFSKALNYDENKIDFGYGGHINDTTRFHIGGFFKDGDGPTHIGYNAEQGYQIKANLTKEFADDKGYVRINFKRLDDKEPTYTTAPSLVGLNGNTVTGFSPFPGFDARSGSNQSILNQNFQVLNYDGTLGTAQMEGIHSKSTSVGIELHYNITNQITVDDKARWTDQSGTFHTQFVTPALASSVIGSMVNGQTVGKIVYANGPSVGQVFSGNFLNEGPNIDTNMPDTGSIVNDLTLTGKFDLAGGKLTPKAGWFHMTQRVNENWHVNPQYNELTGVNPAQLDLISTSGALLTALGQSGFNNNWGSCCAREYDLSYTDDAGYFGADYALGKFDVDGSVRIDSVKAGGWALGGVAGPNTTVSDANGTAVLPSLIAGGPQDSLNYRVTYTSYSFGLLYALDADTSFFGRISRGGRFNADREILGGNFNADGSLTPSGQTTAVNYVTQQEIGVKRQGSLFGAAYTAELTGFRAQLTDNNYDFTLISLGENPVIANVYHSYGVEFTGSVRYGHFSLYADATLLHARIIASSGTAVNFTPHALPAFTYLISPEYDMGMAAIGLSINGQSATYDDDNDDYKIPGQSYLNGFIKIRPYHGLVLGLNANNLLNTLGYRGSGTVVPINATQGVIENSAVLGRTLTASLTFSF